MVSKPLLVLLVLLSIGSSQDIVEEDTSTDDSTETSDQPSDLTDTTESSDLDLAIDAAETELVDTPLITSDDLYENAEALQEVLDLMESTNTETVTIIGVDYDTTSLSAFIEDLELEATEQELIEEAVEVAESILEYGNEDDPTSQQLYDYAEALENVLVLMEEDDTAIIFDVQYTYIEVEGLIEQAYDNALEAEELEALEEMADETLEGYLEEEVVIGLEALENDELSDDEKADLASTIEELLEVLEEGDTIGEGEDELTTDELEEIGNQLEEDLNIDEEEAAFAAENELNEDGTTSDDLEEDLLAIQELIDTLDDGSVVTINNEDYDEEELEELAQSIEEDIQEQEEIENAVELAEEIIDGYDVLTSEQLFAYAEALEIVYDLMDNDDYAYIFDILYTKDQVDVLIDEIIAEAEATEELEILAIEAEEVLEDELISDINEALEIDDLTAEEESQLAEDLEKLSEEIEDGEEVVIDGEDADSDDLIALAEIVEENAGESAELAEAEAVLSDDEEPTAEDLEDLIDELDDIVVIETIVIDDVVIEDQDDLEVYIDDLEIELVVLETEEALAEEIAEAEEILVEDQEATSDDLFELAEALEDVLALMPVDSTVVVDGIEYDYLSLEAYINELYSESEALLHEETLADLVEEAEAVYGDGSTSDQLLAYIDILESILETMNENDIVIIFDDEYTEEDIENEILETVEDAEELIEIEELNDDILDIELTSEVTTSDEVEDLIGEYEDLIVEMGDIGEDTIVVSDIELTVDDIEDIIEDLDDLAIELATQEEIDEIALEIETYVDQYVAEDGTVYITAELLEGELDLWIELEEALDEGETVIVDGWEYNDDTVDDFIEEIKKTLEMLEEDDLVQVVADGELSYITEDEYENMLEINEIIEEIEDIMSLETLTSSDMFALSDAVKVLIELLDPEDTVVIMGSEYSYDGLVSFAEEVEVEATLLANQEKLNTLASVVTDLLISSNEYTTEDELEVLLEAWGNLYEAMDDTDVVEVNYEIYTKDQIVSEIDDIEDYINELDDGEILYTDPDTGDVDFQTAVVIDSGALTSDAFVDLIISGVDFDNDLVVISTADSSDTIASTNDEPLTLVVISTSVSVGITPAFMQTQQTDSDLERDEDEAPTEDSDDIPGLEYSSGEVNFILITSYIPDEEGTGKVFVIPEDNVEDYTTLLVGLHEPTGLCFDVNHNFLYVADQGGFDEGKVYQYQIYWLNDEKFELATSAYVEIYTGSPSDCKVDAYGNLYITDSDANSINKVLYADLYNGYTDAYTTLYNVDDTNQLIDIPISIELLESDEIYFVNNGDVTNAGTLNKAEAEIQTTNEEEIQQLVYDDIPAWGVAIANRWAYYSLNNGDIEGYNIDGKNIESFSKGYFIAPRGLCYGDGKIYVADNGAGALYKIDEESYEEPDIVLYLQAIRSCFCVNSGVSDGSLVVTVALSMLWLVC